MKMKWFDLTFFQSFFEIVFDRPRLTKTHLLSGEDICFGIYLVRLDVLLQDLKQEIWNRNDTDGAFCFWWSDNDFCIMFGIICVILDSV